MIAAALLSSQLAIAVRQSQTKTESQIRRPLAAVGCQGRPPSSRPQTAIGARHPLILVRYEVKVAFVPPQWSWICPGGCCCSVDADAEALLPGRLPDVTRAAAASLSLSLSHPVLAHPHPHPIPSQSTIPSQSAIASAFASYPVPGPRSHSPTLPIPPVSIYSFPPSSHFFPSSFPSTLSISHTRFTYYNRFNLSKV